MTNRNLYFSLLKLNNQYLNSSTIKLFLLFINSFKNEQELFLNFDQEIVYPKLDSDISLLKKGYPIQYLIQKSSFCGMDLFIKEGVLIPRNETEELVIETVKFVHYFFNNDNKLNVLDLCCGSGCIGLGLKKYLRSINLFSSDISDTCLEVTKINSDKLNLASTIIKSDLFSSFEKDLKFDVIISNPPYISDISTIEKRVYDYEPHLALLAASSTTFYERIFEEYKKFVNKKFVLAFEINERDKNKLEDLVKNKYKFVHYYFKKDMYNKDRFLFIYENNDY